MNQILGSATDSASIMRWIPFAGVALLLAGCSGSSSSADAIGSSGGAFQLTTISVSNGQTWQINRPIVFTFTTPVNFSSVSLNTISIQDVTGVPAIGEFFLDPLDDKKVIFQPVCPTLDDFSNAGFRPGAVIYQINLPTTATGPVTVVSTAGKPLTSSFARSFVTPDTSVLATLFLDPLPGPARPVVSPGTGTSVVFGEGGTANEVYFEVQPDGSGQLPGGMLISNNFYSVSDSRIEMNLRFDQPVSPTAVNISSNRLLLQYMDGGGTWTDMNTELLLESNCSGTGASVRINPVGVIPQGRPMRIVVTPQFEDLVGDRNPNPLLNFAQMDADYAHDEGSTTPVETADEFLENYLDQAFEDTTAPLTAPRANWGPDGLDALFAFTGTGGPGGEFDVHVAPGTELIFDTTSTLILGGPGGIPTNSQLAVNGRLDVRNLFVPDTATLRIQGPNAALFLASGTVIIDGRLAIDGGNAKSVFTLNTPTQPEPGAAGRGGGGDGGIGSFLTTAVTPRGGNGEGAYGAPNLGGEGGEAGWNPSGSGSGNLRRAAGGGGGQLGHNQLIDVGGIPCPDEARIGLDAESGFPGAETAFSSQDMGTHLPYGGHVGPSPFGVTETTDDDFQGTKLANIGQADEQLIVGELNEAVPGSGGGAGGDATLAASYPPTELINVNQDKGAGGGGGAGALTILALGNITIGNGGKISARGGHGNGGENTSGVNRIGGGSGGGSGGHLVLQTGGRIDFSSVTATFAALDAKGGQGGAGIANTGGATTNGETSPGADSKHIGANNVGPGVSDNPWLIIDPACAASTLRITAGGDGGPGVIQLHVGDLGADITYPGGGVSTLRNMSSPVPHGYDVFTSTWRDQLLPVFGRLSMAQSRWIALGEPAVDPVSPTPSSIAFLFSGTNPADGLVNQTGDFVTPEAPLMSGMLTLDPADTTNRTGFMDATALLGGADEIYTRNPNLLRNFHLVPGPAFFHNIASATYDAGTMMFTIVVDSSGPELFTGTFDLIPRFFGVTTGGLDGNLPDTATITVEFELMGERYPGSAAPDATVSTGFLTDIQAATAMINQTDYAIRFMRYRILFDIDAMNSGELGFNTPRPTLDFLRIPFRF